MLATDWAYLAGVLDSDGCVSISKQTRNNRPYYSLRVFIANSSRPLIDWLLTNIGGSAFISNRHAPKHHKTVWRWTVRGYEAIPILRKVIPYLRVKCKRAELAIQFAKTLRSDSRKLTDKELKQRERLHAILRSMNTTGRLR